MVESSSGAAGHLAANVTHFARVLRRAGLPIGTHKIIGALEAVQIVGVERRDDFYSALSAVLVDRHEQQELFDQAFEAFWRAPVSLNAAMSDLLAQVSGRSAQDREQSPLRQRIAQAMFPGSSGTHQETEPHRELRFDAVWTFSAREVLQKKDFETMTAEELAEVKRVIAECALPLPELATRRYGPDAHGARVDMRASLRECINGRAALVPLRWRSPRMRHPPLVILCDISGSMERYARMCLHFIHAIVNDHDRVHALLFGTRLTNITRQMRDRDVDVALAKVSALVADWAGGTRIGACLKEFNVRWARRLLGQGAVVLLISDGLDSDAGEGLAREIQRLRKSCRRLIWLNPLLRYGGFEAKPAGIKAMLPHVDAFLPVHNLTSLKQLGEALAELAHRHAGPQAPRSASATIGPRPRSVYGV
jgi:uncharacterized protein